MSQCCVKICTPQDMAQSNASRKTQPTIDIGGRQYEPAKNEMEMRRIGIDNMKSNPNNQHDQTTKTSPTQIQGSIGEYMAENVMVEQLGISLIDFTKRTHGVDSFGIDKEGHYCLIEAKCTVGRNGQNDLGKYDLKYQDGSLVLDENNEPMKMRQSGDNWITDRLNSMQTPRHELYSEKNAKLAKEVQAAIDRGDTVRRILIHTNVNTLNITVSEDQGNGNWQIQSAFRCIDE